MSATEANGWSIFGPPIRGRSCGGCKLCCTLVPVQLREGHKPSGVRCPHLTSRGCSVYATRPRPCWAWSCRWLFDESTVVPGIRRPDLAGYAIDPMLDTILVDEQPVEVIQVWVDPARRDAHRDPALRAWLAAMCAPVTPVNDIFTFRLRGDGTVVVRLDVTLPYARGAELLKFLLGFGLVPAAEEPTTTEGKSHDQGPGPTLDGNVRGAEPV